jgi:hypothetical protein
MFRLDLNLHGDLRHPNALCLRVGRVAQLELHPVLEFRQDVGFTRSGRTCDTDDGDGFLDVPDDVQRFLAEDEVFVEPRSLQASATVRQTMLGNNN